MKKLLLAGLCLFFSSSGLLLAQNKTFGVGVTAPNANAALHVESPTNNQGFIMPRLTTAQREAMGSLLTVSDKGLMLYDTDRSAIFIWDGAVWKSSSEFSLTDTTSTTSVISVLNKGLGNAGRFQNQNRRSKTPALWAESNSDSALSAPIYGFNTGSGDVAGSFRIENPANPNAALYSETNGSGPAVYGNQPGLGRAGQFQITNTANTQASIRGYTAGTGNAGFYTINNALNDSSAIYSTTNGTGPAIAGLTTGTGPAAAFRVANTASGAEALFVESYGTGRTATFRKTATTGGAPAIFVDTQGGHGIWADHNGSNGYAAIIQTINTANPNSAMFIESIGTGPSMWIQKSTSAVSGDALVAENNIATGGAARFMLTDPTNTSPAINTVTSGTGSAIRAENSGAGDGFAGNFEVTNTTNTFPAIQASSAGAGSGVRVMQNKGTGAGMDVFMQNLTSSAPGLAVDQQGLGHAASFNVANASNGLSALQVNTAGTSFAINARHTGTAGDAIYAEHAGIANASAGNFRISHAENSASAVHGSTIAPGGVAMSANNEANGLAFAVWGGGMKVSTHTLSADGSISTRASAYLITGGISYTLGFIMNEGEIVYFFNSTTAEVSVDGFSIPPTAGKTCIFLGGALRAL